MHFRGDPDLDSLNRDLAETVQKVRETAPQVRSSRVYKEKGQLRLKFASVKGRNLADTLFIFILFQFRTQSTTIIKKKKKKKCIQLYIQGNMLINLYINSLSLKLIHHM